MFMGAYWSQRQESRDQVADRIGRFLKAIAVHGNSFSTWYLKARTKAAAYATPLPCDPRAIARGLGVNRRDSDGGVMPELGFNLGIWNGEHVPLRLSMRMTMGAYSPHVNNAFVLSTRPEDLAMDKATWRGLMADAIEAFDPDHAVVTSLEIMRQAGARMPWEAGWLTYERNHEIVEHPWGQ